MSKKKNRAKWIEGIRPDEPVSKAATKTLRRRLHAVWDALTEAASPHTGDSPADAATAVHQLRVATRRGMAAMQGYAELLPRKKSAWVEKQLKRLRRRAGDARDYDVLVERLGKRDDADRLQPLVDRLSAMRLEAQRPIVRVHRRLCDRDFPGRVKRMLRKIHAPRHGREATFLAWARLGLSRNIDAFFTAAAGDLNDITALHQFRIEGKLLRYALEYFGAAFGPPVREQAYPQIVQMQNLLGLVNDHASALAHFETWQTEWDDDELKPLLAGLISEEQTALDETRREFFRWWTPQRAAELKQLLDALPANPNREEVA